MDVTTAVDRILPAHTGTPEQVATDESYWDAVRDAFCIDPNVIHLNNAGHNPMPRVVADAVRREFDLANRNPIKAMGSVGEKRNVARAALAEVFGCEPDEIAITRNCCESMEICQLGIDLEPGDEVLTTTMDYPRLIQTFEQRERRDGVVLKRFSFPVPSEDPQEILDLFEENITPRTRMILMCHVITMTGQMMPVRAVVELARKRGIPVLVDGAQSFAHLAFKQADLDCDFFGTSLHKWLKAPCGSGMLFVRKNRIAEVWPMMAAQQELNNHIDKFEQTGTAPSIHAAAIPAAVAFYLKIGPEYKEARLRYLRDRWARRLAQHDRVRLHTSLRPEFSCGLGLVEIDGVSTNLLGRYLREEHKIVIHSLDFPDCKGIRASANVYTNLDEVDRFSEVMESVMRDGLPR